MSEVVCPQCAQPGRETKHAPVLPFSYVCDPAYEYGFYTCAHEHVWLQTTDPRFA